MQYVCFVIVGDFGEDVFKGVVQIEGQCCWFQMSEVEKFGWNIVYQYNFCFYNVCVYFYKIGGNFFVKDMFDEEVLDYVNVYNIFVFLFKDIVVVVDFNEQVVIVEQLGVDDFGKIFKKNVV